MPAGRPRKYKTEEQAKAAKAEQNKAYNAKHVKHINLPKEIVETKEITYLDAIMDYCQKNNLEVESAAKLVNQKIKAQLKVEATELKLIKPNE